MHHQRMTTEDQKSKILMTKTQMTRREAKESSRVAFETFPIAEKLEIIDHFKRDNRNTGSNKPVYLPTVKWAREKYHRNTISRNTIKRILNSETKIQASNGSKRTTRKTGIQDREGVFPEMEIDLAKSIRELRDLGIPVETYMVQEEARNIHRKTYPTLWTTLTEPFKFSNNWMSAFFRRFGFSRRVIGMKKKIMKNMENLRASIVEFHLNTRALQLSVINDPVWGYTSPYCVFNRDQVPIALCASTNTTIDDTGIEYVWDGMGDEGEDKRFCSLNLTIPMRVHPSKKNVPKPHIVFKASGFRKAEDWDPSETQEYDPRCIVSFQRNAWVDAETNQHGLEMNMVAMNDFCEEMNLPGVQFEDNLSSHKTNASLDRFSELLPKFAKPQYFPPGTTYCTQPVDRNVGKRYKTPVYKSIRELIMAKWREARDAGDAYAIPKRLTPREKRILITKVIGDIHEQLANNDAFFRAFIATGTWMPIYHCVDSASLGPLNVPEDMQVDLQGFTKKGVDCYKYEENCDRAAILSHVQKLKAAQAAAEAAAEEAAAQRVLQEQEEMNELAPFVEAGSTLLRMIDTHLPENLDDILEAIGAHIGKPSFICGGSWPAMLISNAVFDFAVEDEDSTMVVEILDGLDAIELKSNDIDLYHGTDGNGSLCVLWDRIQYQNVDNVPLEVNTVECRNLNARNILDNNDINATAVVMEVTSVSPAVEYSFKIAPSFWKFLLTNDHTLQAVKKESAGARTFVRLVYKAFQMGLPYEADGIDPEGEILAKSHADKIEAMKDWQDNPFRYMNLTSSNNTFRLKKLIRSEKCVNCTTKAGNKQCPLRMCKRCCNAQTEMTCRQHKSNRTEESS